MKSRVIRDGEPASARRTSPFRTWGFDIAVIVLFSDDDLSVVRASELTREVVERESRFVPHINGSVLAANPEIMESGRDVTGRLIRAAATL